MSGHILELWPIRDQHRCESHAILGTMQQVDLVQSWTSKMNLKTLHVPAKAMYVALASIQPFLFHHQVEPPVLYALPASDLRLRNRKSDRKELLCMVEFVFGPQ